MYSDKNNNSIFNSKTMDNSNDKLYSFLATSYDLSALASKVRMNYGARKNVLALKMNGTNGI